MALQKWYRKLIIWGLSFGILLSGGLNTLVNADSGLNHFFPEKDWAAAGVQTDQVTREFFEQSGMQLPSHGVLDLNDGSILDNQLTPNEKPPKLKNDDFRVLTLTATEWNVRNWNTAQTGDELVASAETKNEAAGQQELAAEAGPNIIRKQ